MVYGGEPFTMGQLRALVGNDVADQLVLNEELDDEGGEPVPQHVRPIADETVLTSDDIDEDGLEDHLWIHKIMESELSASVQVLDESHGFRSVFTIPERRLDDVETLLAQQGTTLVRDDELIATAHDHSVDLEQAFAAKDRIEQLVGSWAADAD